MTIQELLIKHENDRQYPYDDATGTTLAPGDTLRGKLSIGIGRNLTDVGLSESERLYLLENDIGRVRTELDQALPWWRELDETRQLVMLDLGFNMGVLTPPETAQLLTFTHTLDLIRSGRYAAAADNLTKTKWHGQVGRRAWDIESMLRQPEEA